MLCKIVKISTITNARAAGDRSSLDLRAGCYVTPSLRLDKKIARLQRLIQRRKVRLAELEQQRREIHNELQENADE